MTKKYLNRSDFKSPEYVPAFISSTNPQDIVLKSLKHISKNVKRQLRRKEKFKASNPSAPNYEIKDNNGYFILTPSNICTLSYNIFLKYRSHNVFNILQEDDVF